MTEITGVVESKKRDGKAIKVDGVWHGAYNAITLSGVNEGDMVTFTSVPSADGRFNNIKGKVLMATGTAPTGTGTTFTPPKPEPVRNPHYQFPISPTDSQRSILRQNALTNARELVTWLYGEDDASITIDYVHDIITIARKFEEYTSGDMDIAIAKEQIRKMEAE